MSTYHWVAIRAGQTLNESIVVMDQNKMKCSFSACKINLNERIELQFCLIETRVVMATCLGMLVQKCDKTLYAIKIIY